MKVLVTNDDGIKARGIAELSEALAEAGAEVYVVAPEEEQSAASQKVSMRVGLYVRELPEEEKLRPSVGPDGREGPSLKAAARAFYINGTPADCVKLGLHALAGEGVQIAAVFAGINHGGNLGRDTFYSGTVAAAREGCLCGKLSAAVSITGRSPVDYMPARELAVFAYRELLPKLGREFPNSFLNINLPNRRAAELRGVRICGLGPREYDGEFERRAEADGERRYWYSGEPFKYPGLGDKIDVAASDMDHPTITPIHTLCTDFEMMKRIEKYMAESR